MNDITCRILLGGKEVFLSDERGIAPLIKIVQGGFDVKGGTAYDKIVGKAAALLYVLMEIGCVNAEVISSSAIEVFKAHAIKFTYKALAEKIINRRGDGVCPMEATVENIQDPYSAYVALKEKLTEIRK